MGMLYNAFTTLGSALGGAASSMGGAMNSMSGAVSSMGNMAEGALSNAFGADNISSIQGAMNQADKLGTLLGGGSGGSAPPPPSQVPTSKVGVQAAPAISGGEGALGAGMSAEDIRNATRKKGLF